MVVQTTVTLCWCLLSHWLIQYLAMQVIARNWPSLQLLLRPPTGTRIESWLRISIKQPPNLDFLCCLWQQFFESRQQLSQQWTDGLQYKSYSPRCCSSSVVRLDEEEHLQSRLESWGQSQCKDCFAADVGHVRCRDSVVGSQSQVSGSEKGGEGQGWPSVMRRGRGR